MTSDRDNELGSGMREGSSFGPGMEEQHQPLGGLPGGDDQSVRGMASKAGEKLMDTAERQKLAGVDFIDGLAGAVRRAAGEFEGQSPQAASYIRSAADQVETMSDSLRRRDVGQMFADVQTFARQQPTAFLGMSFLAGFAAVRFLRSGSGTSGSGNGGSWQNRQTADSGRYGGAAGAGSGSFPGTSPNQGF